MKPEKRLLIHDLLITDDLDARREATLLAGGRLLRRRRMRRAAAQSLVVVAMIAIVTASLLRTNPPRPPTVAKTSAPSPPVRDLSDDELLALFPNTPVGLATVDGRKVLVFPRPGDQERFVGKF